MFQNLNWQHDSQSISFDGYFDGSWRSSTTSSNFQITKGSSSLAFTYGSGVAAGSPLTWTTAGSITTAGTLQWSKLIKTADTTDASSTTTGALTSAGGLGVAGRAYVGGMFHGLADVSLCGLAGLGSGSGVIGIVNASVVPSTNPTGGGVLYSQAGDLKWRGSSGTVTTIAPA